MARPVYFYPLAETDSVSNEALIAGIGQLCAKAGLSGAGGTPAHWAFKVDVGEPGRPPAIDPAWMDAVAGHLESSGAFAFDTLSIMKAELADVDRHLRLAAAKGFAATEDGGGQKSRVPYFVADDGQAGESSAVGLAPDSELDAIGLAGRLKNVDGICLMTPVRPHPHLGLRGAVASLGVGLCDRESKIALHRDIRPQVDTPLCAGCGSCLAVCLFDAIVLRAGRAFIDHKRCTGCGECMNVCFMAGIAAEEAVGIDRFQVKVAEAALAARNAVSGADSRRQLYFNFLVRVDRGAGGARARQRDRVGDVGILAASDPVAVDQASIDLIRDKSLGELSSWSGFRQTPERLMARAVELGLGKREYTLVNV